MTDRTYEVNFLLRLLNKDVRYAQAAAADTGVTLTTAAVTEKLFDKAETAGPWREGYVGRRRGSSRRATA